MRALSKMRCEHAFVPALHMIAAVDTLAPRADSIQPTSVLRCGHTLHEHCFQAMQQNNQTACPVCMKSFANMQPVGHRPCLCTLLSIRILCSSAHVFTLCLWRHRTQGIKRGLSAWCHW